MTDEGAIALLPAAEETSLGLKQIALLDALRAGNTRTAAYRVADVPKSTFYRWMTDSETFRDSVERAESDAQVSFVSVIHGCAAGGTLKKRVVRQKEDGSVDVIEEFTEPDWRAAAWWLEHRRSEWLQTETPDLSELTNDQIAALLEDQDQKGEAETPAPDDVAGVADSASGIVP